MTKNSHETLGKQIRTLVADGDAAQSAADELFIKAGNLLKALKSQKPKDVSWSHWVKGLTGLARSRADQLIRIATSKTTLSAERRATADRVAKSKAAATSGDLVGHLNAILAIARTTGPTHVDLSVEELTEIAAFLTRTITSHPHQSTRPTTIAPPPGVLIFPVSGSPQPSQLLSTDTKQ